MGTFKIELAFTHKRQGEIGMKTFLTYFFIFFTTNIYSQDFQSEYCDKPTDKLRVAEALIQMCLGDQKLSNDNIKNLSRDITLEDNSEASTYLDITIFFKDELIGTHTLYTKGFDFECWQEELFEISCPIKL